MMNIPHDDVAAAHVSMSDLVAPTLHGILSDTADW
jgi:hypothetical protein